MSSCVFNKNGRQCCSKREREKHRQCGGNITMYVAITLNGVLHRHANLVPYNMVHIFTFLDRLHNIITAEDQMDAEQMRYIVIWDNVSFHRSALVQKWFHKHPQFFCDGGVRYDLSPMSGYPSFKPWRRLVT